MILGLVLLLKLGDSIPLDGELPGENTHRAMNVLDTPVLITRSKDNQVRAFLNVCRHRGSKVCEEGSGEKRNFIYQYLLKIKT